MYGLKDDFLGVLNHQREHGPCFDIEIRFDVGNTDCIEIVQKFLDEVGVQHDLRADIDLRRDSPKEKPKPYIRKYTLLVDDVPEEILKHLYDLNETFQIREGKNLFEEILEHPLDDSQWDAVMDEEPSSDNPHNDKFDAG